MTEEEIQKIEEAMEVLMCPTIDEGRALIARVRELEAAQQGCDPFIEPPKRNQRVIVQVEGWTVLKIGELCPRWWLIDSNLSDGSSEKVDLDNVERWWPMPEKVKL